LVEETGLIVAIGSWVLRQACTDFQFLQQPFGGDLVLSVNVSSRQLDEPTFLAQLSSVIKQTGIDPHLLQLEITEGIFLRDSLRIGALFQAIRALGVKIAFDDFGTGYSSLSYLERYPVDMVKIDQYFVVRLAHAIGMSVSAEGVENREQAAALSGFGCNIAQGYLYSQPLSFHALTWMLAHPQA
jgi:EAL domain-containing protein (putative c-di-GMP-specific phosphodiesterase class I)